jgi:phytoene synthase
MSLDSGSLSASYAYCRSVVRRAGSSFGPCFWLLEEEKRRAMDALYAFMRHSDDLADNPQPVAQRREHLSQWRAALDDALESSGHTACCSRRTPCAVRLEVPMRFPHFTADGTRSVPATMADGTRRVPAALLPALADAVRRFAIPVEHLHAVLDGVQMDLEGTRYETFDQLRVYCRRVASAVGLACIHVWGFSDARALEPAEHCGVAFQMTNILRDLAEDAAAGRVYLPQEDLCRCGYSREDLQAGRADDRFLRLVAIQVERTRQLYRQGAELAAYLSADGRRIFGLMSSVYARLLERIAQHPAGVLAGRVRLNGWEKLTMAMRWSLLPVGSAAIAVPAGARIRNTEY